MREYRFELVPGKFGGSSASANPLQDIKMLREPPEGTPVRAMLDAMGWPFAGDDLAAFRTYVIASARKTIIDAGLLDDLDFLYIATGDMAGSVINLIDGKVAATATGVVFDDGAIQTNGVDNFFSANFSDNREKWTMNDACAFVYLSETPPKDLATSPIIGNGGIGDDAVRIHRNSDSPFYQVRVNSLSTHLTGFPGDSVWGPGLWAVERTSATNIAMRKNGQIIGAASDSASTSIATGMAVGHGATLYAAQSFTIFGAGRAFSADKHSTLATLGADLAAFFAWWSNQ